VDPATKSLVQSQFGPNAANYATSRVHAEGASLARLVELIQPQRHWRVLDVATGAGHTAFALAPDVAHVIASDLTPQMLHVARDLAAKRGLSNITFAEAAAENLPFADASFDLVTCRIAPHHFADVKRFVTEVARVLKQGGLFGLVDNISPDDAGAAKQYNAIEKLRDPSHARCLGVGEWLELIERAGLIVRHREVLIKDMDFLGWAGRMQVSDAVQCELRSLLLNNAPALQAFLNTRTVGDDLTFSIAEVVIVAERSAQR
jgi:ubiquinone/menaquinone biosynthesis C-methylase UbiE